MEAKIRKAKKEDKQKIERWNRELFSISFPGEKYKKKLLRGRLFVLELNKNIAGFLLLKSGGNISKIFVEKKHRGRGFGKMLMDFAMNYFKKLKKVRLTVTASNKPALNLYKKSGFKIKRYVMEKNTK